MGIKFYKTSLKKEILRKAFYGELTEQNYDEGTGKELLRDIQLERTQNLLKDKDESTLSSFGKDEESYELPPNWTWTRLGEVIKLISGRDEAISQTNEMGNGTPYIMGASNFKDGSIRVERWIECPKVISIPNDILITVKGTVGKMIINKDKTYNLSRQIMAIRTSQVKNTFIYHFLSYQIQNISSQSNGVIPGISRNILLDLPIPLPPLAEQERIVAKIERAFELIDSMDVDSLLQDISDFRQEILTRAFRGDLTEQNFDEGTGMELLKSIQLEKQLNQPAKGKKKTELTPVSKEEEPYELPPNWTWTRLGEVGEVVGGGTPSTSNSEYWSDSWTGIPWTTPADLSGYKDMFFDKPQRYISELGLNSSSTKIMKKGSVLFTSRAPIGYVAIANCDICTNQGFKAVDVNERMSNKYIYFYFKAFKDEIADKGTGTTFKEVSGTVVKNLTFPLPPLAEQHRIVTKIEAIFSALDVMEDAITKQKYEAKSCYEEILKNEMEADVACGKEPEKTSEEKAVTTVA